jgi:hypothetical protein
MKAERIVLFAVAGLVATLLMVCWQTYGQSHSVIDVGKFSAESPGKSLPAGWKPLTFKKIETHTSYTLVK